MKRILALLMLAVVTMSLSTACGGPANNLSVFGAAGGPVPAGHPTPRPNPDTTTSASSFCALATTAEVSTAAAKPMKLTADGGVIGECIYSATSDASFVMYISVDKSSVDIDQRKQQLESLSQHVAGVGDDAFWNATLGEIFIQQGARALIIILPSLANLTNQPDASKQRMITLGKEVLARL